MAKKKTCSVTCPGCGRRRIVAIYDWAKRKSDYCRSCACRVRAGLTASDRPSEKGTPLHNAWRGMRQRCGYLQGGHAIDLKHYQQRGIAVCAEWRASYFPFRDWALANGYKPGLLLDRRDNNAGYCPENCRWVTITESNRNRRDRLTADDVEEIRAAAVLGAKQRDLARIYDVSEATISIVVNRLSWR